MEENRSCHLSDHNGDPEGTQHSRRRLYTSISQCACVRAYVGIRVTRTVCVGIRVTRTVCAAFTVKRWRLRRRLWSEARQRGVMEATDSVCMKLPEQPMVITGECFTTRAFWPCQVQNKTCICHM